MSATAGWNHVPLLAAKNHPHSNDAAPSHFAAVSCMTRLFSACGGEIASSAVSASWPHGPRIAEVHRFWLRGKNAYSFVRN
jgi:hypothetical protein